MYWRCRYGSAVSAKFARLLLGLELGSATLTPHPRAVRRVQRPLAVIHGQHDRYTVQILLSSDPQDTHTDSASVTKNNSGFYMRSRFADLGKVKYDVKFWQKWLKLLQTISEFYTRTYMHVKMFNWKGNVELKYIRVFLLSHRSE